MCSSVDFPDPGRADDRDVVAPAHPKVDVAQRPHRRIGRERPVHAVQHDHRRRAPVMTCPPRPGHRPPSAPARRRDLDQTQRGSARGSPAPSAPGLPWRHGPCARPSAAVNTAATGTTSTRRRVADRHRDLVACPEYRASAAESAGVYRSGVAAVPSRAPGVETDAFLLRTRRRRARSGGGGRCRGGADRGDRAGSPRAVRCGGGRGHAGVQQARVVAGARWPARRPSSR